MIEIELINGSKRLKRPRIQRATVPGESEKVNIVYDFKRTSEKVKPRDIKIDSVKSSDKEIS